MLLSSKMASIPCSPRHSLSNMKDFQDLFRNPRVPLVSPPTTPALQYFNMRVTARLHRYRSLKRQWQEIATAVQNDPSLSPNCESPSANPDLSSSTQEQSTETKVYNIKDYLSSRTTKESNEKTSVELDPLHSRIQKDLIKLRSLIKSRQRRLTETISFKSSINHRLSGEAPINTAFDDQGNNNNNTTIIRKSPSLNRAKPLDRVKISGCQMRPSTFPQSNATGDNGNLLISNPPSNCSQYFKQQKFKHKNNNKTFNIYRSRVNPPLPSDSLLHGIPPPKKKSHTPPKTIQNTNLKLTQSYRLPIPSILKKKQASFIKQETILPSIRQPSIMERATTKIQTTTTTTCLYTYAASSSSASPSFMKLNRNTSLLPILLASSSCIGIQSGEGLLEKENLEDEDYHNILDYKQLINHIPKPIIPILSGYDQDEYEILLEQLKHIRRTMPDSNVYDNYTRIC